MEKILHNFIENKIYFAHCQPTIIQPIISRFWNKRASLKMILNVKEFSFR